MMKKAFKFEVRDEKKIRVIVDTDAACEADDPFAIAHALLSPKLIVEGITAEHFAKTDSVQRSFEEIRTITEAMGMNVPIFLGEEGALDEQASGNSQAVEFIIEQALKEENHPLYILAMGAITNVAAAFRKCPEIIKRVTVVWIGTHGSRYGTVPFREFNAGNDVKAANEVLQSGTRIWLIPSYVYTTMHIGLAEIQNRIYPYGEIGRHLFENMVSYNMTDEAAWTQGESWSLGDSPSVAVTLNPECGHYAETKAPWVGEDTSSVPREDSPLIRVYSDVDSRYVLEDFINKLQLQYS